jgi:molybdenum cofactor biosynthesis protein B
VGVSDSFIVLRCGVLTISDTRTIDNDTSGRLIVDRLTAAGHHIYRRQLVPDDFDVIRKSLMEFIADDAVDVVITTGGTGVTRSDVTPEVLRSLATKPIPGFGELFRWLSFAEIGTSTIQSRADAAVCESTLVFILPGSTGAVRLALDRILINQLDARHEPCNFAELLPRIRGHRGAS